MRDDFIFPKIELPMPIGDTDLEDMGKLLTDQMIKPFIREEIAKLKKDELWVYGRDNFFNEDGTHWEMSPGELAMFSVIVSRSHPRVSIVCSTQYGKTMTVSRAILSHITNYPGDWQIVVPDVKRGRIMINYIIRDTAANEYFASKLAGINIKEKNLLMRLLEEKSKVKLTYMAIEDGAGPKYGTVEILTAEARRKQNAITSIMGFGGRNVIADESALEDDEIDAGIFRMLAGKGKDTLLVKIGNPFFRNHFMTDWKSEGYKKIFVDYQIGLAEGRYEKNFIEEARKKPQFDVLFKCKFPSADAIDAEGWQQLISEEEIRLAMQGGAHFGESRLGIDPADSGTDDAAIIRRSAGYAEILFRQLGLDQMDFTGQCVLKIDEVKVKRIYVDKVQIGTYSRLNEINRVNEKKWNLTGVNAGEATIDPKFFNKKAEMFWRVREWLKSGGKLSLDAAWMQLARIKYRTVESQGTIQIMPKEVMRKKGIPSPGAADAIALTFYDPPKALAATEEDKFFMKKMRQQQKKKTKGYGLRMIGH